MLEHCSNVRNGRTERELRTRRQHKTTTKMLGKGYQESDEDVVCDTMDVSSICGGRSNDGVIDDGHTTMATINPPTLTAARATPTNCENCMLSSGAGTQQASIAVAALAAFAALCLSSL